MAHCVPSRKSTGGIAARTNGTLSRSAVAATLDERACATRPGRHVEHARRQDHARVVERERASRTAAPRRCSRAQGDRVPFDPVVARSTAAKKASEQGLHQEHVVVEVRRAEEDRRAEGEQQPSATATCFARELPRAQQRCTSGQPSQRRQRRHEERRRDRRRRAEAQVEPRELSPCGTSPAGSGTSCRTSCPAAPRSRPRASPSSAPRARRAPASNTQQRHGRDHRAQDVVADVPVPVRVLEDVGVEPGVLVTDPVPALDQAESRVVLPDHVGREEQRVDDPAAQEDADRNRGEEPHADGSIGTESPFLAPDRLLVPAATHEADVVAELAGGRDDP